MSFPGTSLAGAAARRRETASSSSDGSPGYQVPAMGDLRISPPGISGLLETFSTPEEVNQKGGRGESEGDDQHVSGIRVEVAQGLVSVPYREPGLTEVSHGASHGDRRQEPGNGEA